jgi:hypothetical protein
MVPYFIQKTEEGKKHGVNIGWTMFGQKDPVLCCEACVKDE